MTARPLSVNAAISDRLSGATLKRAIIRAYMADELTITEIADEFGCSRMYVHKVCTGLQETRCRVRRRETARADIAEVVAGADTVPSLDADGGQLWPRKRRAG